MNPLIPSMELVEAPLKELCSYSLPWSNWADRPYKSDRPANGLAA